MNAIKNIYAVLALIALCLSSCEMKNELEGKYNLKNDEGLLTLDLVNKTLLQRLKVHHLLMNWM